MGRIASFSSRWGEQLADSSPRQVHGHLLQVCTDRCAPRLVKEPSEELTTPLAGERLSPYVALACVIMAIQILIA